METAGTTMAAAVAVIEQQAEEVATKRRLRRDHGQKKGRCTENVLPRTSRKASTAAVVALVCLTIQSLSSFNLVGASSSSSSAGDSTSDGQEEEGHFSTLFRHLLSMSLCVFVLMTVYFHQYAASAFIRQYFDISKTATIKGRVVCCESTTKTAPSPPMHLPTNISHDEYANTDVETDHEHKERIQDFPQHDDQMLDLSSAKRQVRIAPLNGRFHEFPNSSTAAAAAAANPNLKVHSMMDVSALSVNSAMSQHDQYLEMADGATAEANAATSFDPSHHDDAGSSSRRSRRVRTRLQRLLQKGHGHDSNYVHHSNKKYRVFVLYHVPIRTNKQNILCGDPTAAISSCYKPSDAILDMYHTGPTGGTMNDQATATTAPKPSQNSSSIVNVEYQQIYLSDRYHHVNTWVDLIMLKDIPTSACTREILQEQLLHIEKTSPTSSSSNSKMVKCGTVPIATTCSVIGFIVLVAFSLSEVSELSTVNGNRSKGYYMISTAVVGSILVSYTICKALNGHYIRREFLSAVPSPVQPTSSSTASTMTQPWHRNHPQLVHHQHRLQQLSQHQQQLEQLQYHELRKMAEGGQRHDQGMDDSMMTNATPLPPLSTTMFQQRPPAPPNPTRPFVSLTTGSSSKKITNVGGSNTTHDFSGSGTSTSTEKFSNVQQSFVRRSSHQLMFPPVGTIDDGNHDDNGTGVIDHDKQAQLDRPASFDGYDAKCIVVKDGVTVPAG
mmetsp:Transcript_54332/g.131868  ORF Transcript_54332/g.131868 Transcript_54332/m.131868 type:complete len:724 (-) Transcript_54332:1327-3498(-)